VGRPCIELDEARRRRLLEALEVGATLEVAARAAGVSAATLARWRTRDDEVAQAEARGVVAMLDAIHKAATGAHGGTWQAAAWRLERRYPEVYGRRVSRDPEPEQSTIDPETEARMAKIMENLARGADQEKHARLKATMAAGATLRMAAAAVDASDDDLARWGVTAADTLAFG
jgi:transposase